MTSRLGQRAPGSGVLETFPDFPPRDDLQNTLHLYDDGHQAILRRYFGETETTIIFSEVPVRWTPSQRASHRIPDFMIAFNVDRSKVAEQNGYSIRDQGKPPDFVLEVASLTTRNRDLTDKRRDYASFGIPEYWRFDATGGRRYDAPLAGDRLQDGEYQPVRIQELEPGHLHGHSDILELDVCWHQGKLRWFNPSSGEHLLMVDEALDARIAERDDRIAEQDALIAEREARIAEREARIVEQEARIAAEARVRELEEQLRARDQG